MPTAKITYQGNLRTSSIHLQSNNEIITDAPVDNNGKGEAFSPTDLVATSLAACMLTIMGIKSTDLNIDLTGSSAEITKVMGTEPRRITEIHVTFSLTGSPSDKEKTILERAANTCPVLYSIHPDIKKNIIFNWK
jgi:uncharacterized OsmC-like protein